MIHDFIDDHVLNQICIQPIGPRGRNQKVRGSAKVMNSMAGSPRDLHDTGGRLAETEHVWPCAGTTHGRGRRAVDEQVGCVHTANSLAECVFYFGERRQSRSRHRVNRGYDRSHRVHQIVLPRSRSRVAVKRLWSGFAIVNVIGRGPGHGDKTLERLRKREGINRVRARQSRSGAAIDQ